MTEAVLSDNLPGETAVAELLQLQAKAVPRTAFGRLTGANPLAPDARAPYGEAAGEHRTARTLRRLGPEWTVLHSVAVGPRSPQIDHLLVGPAGVFTVDTKNTRDQNVWVAGRDFLVAREPFPYIKVAEQEAKRATALLRAASGVDVEAVPVVAVVSPKRLFIKEKPTKVAVLDSGALPRWLGKRPAALDQAQVAAVRSAAVQPSTWRQDTIPLSPAERAANDAEFLVLDRQVRGARRLRTAWKLALAVLGLTAALFGIQAWGLGLFG